MAGSLNLSLSGSAIVLNWMPPFSLDINGVNPDVTYCVQVVEESTFRVEERMEELECGINVTEFSYSIHVPLRSWCYDFSFTVTPLNLAGIGASNSILHISPEPEGSELII